jgi:CheY-like chemotaxis protein
MVPGNRGKAETVNVLVVDDEPMLRKMVAVMLRNDGHQALEAASGADAIAMAEKESVDVLVTDVVMEGMDGWTLAQRLTGTRPDLGVVFMSGWPVDFEANRGLCGRCAFLSKPFAKEELMGAIAEVSGSIG